MFGRDKLKADQAWTLERQVRETMKKKGIAPRDAARVAERVRGEQIGVPKDDVARMEAAAKKRARKAGHVLPDGYAIEMAKQEETPTPGVCAPVFFQDEEPKSAPALRLLKDPLQLREEETDEEKGETLPAPVES